MKGPCAAILLLLASAVDAGGQGIRIRGVTSAQYIEARPIVTDSVAVSTVAGEGLLRSGPGGVVVRCIPADPFCRYYRSAATVAAVPLVQDLQLSAWGLGRGVRLFAHVRGRAAGGDASGLWPQADDAFDALAAYVEVDRGRLRVRAGRQWKTSGLGFYNFDGASLLVRPASFLSADLFGGWSLTRGTNEPHTDEALRALENLGPPERAYLFGGELTLRPRAGASVGLLYQRELQTDRAGLYSERAAAAARLQVRRTTLTGSLEADLGAGMLNEARLRADLPAVRGVDGYLELRRYRPFFELWTIWGAFSPVGYQEALAGAHRGPPGGALSLHVRGGWRSYDETDSGVTFAPLRTTGWRVGADAAWRAARALTVEAGYRADIGFGASHGDGDVGIRFDLGERGGVGLRALAYRSIGEFRLEEGAVLGVGADGTLRLSPDARVSGSLSLYRHGREGEFSSVDWTQARGSVRLEWSVGRDPGLRRTPEVLP